MGLVVSQSRCPTRDSDLNGVRGETTVPNDLVDVPRRAVRSARRWCWLTCRSERHDRYCGEHRTRSVDLAAPTCSASLKVCSSGPRVHIGIPVAPHPRNVLSPGPTLSVETQMFVTDSQSEAERFVEAVVRSTPVGRSDIGAWLVGIEGAAVPPRRTVLVYGEEDDLDRGGRIPVRRPPLHPDGVQPARLAKSCQRDAVHVPRRAVRSTRRRRRLTRRTDNGENGDDDRNPQRPTEPCA